MATVRQAQNGHDLAALLLVSLAYKSSRDSYIVLFPRMLSIVITLMIVRPGRASVLVARILIARTIVDVIGLAA